MFTPREKHWATFLATWATVLFALAAGVGQAGAEPDASELQTVRVKVVDGQGTAVAGAQVLVALYGGNSTPKPPRDATVATQSGADGFAELRLPKEARQKTIVAWKSAAGLDYFFIPRPENGELYGPWPDEVRLTLSGARVLKIKAVDRSGAPLAGVAMGVTSVVVPGKIRGMDQQHNPFGVNLSNCPQAAVQTDAAGVATFDWLPHDFLYRVRFQVVSPDYSVWLPHGSTPTLPALMQKQPVEERTVELVHHTSISGKVTLPDGQPADGIEVRAEGVNRQNGPEVHGSARTQVDGSYQMVVAKHRAFMVVVVDPTWAAAGYDRLLMEETPITGIDFQLAKATIVRGTASEGPDRRPVAGVRLFVKREPQRAADDTEFYANDAVRMRTYYYYSLQTDATGAYQLPLGPGTYQIFPAGFPGETIIVDAQAEIVHDLLPSSAAKPLSGKVLDADKQPVAGVILSGTYTGINAGPFHFFDVLTTADDGSFRLVREPLPFALQARTADGRFAALWEVGENQTEANPRLRAVTHAQGRLVDQRGRPVTTGKLEYGLTVDASGGRFKLVLHGETTPGADGRYTLDGLLPRKNSSYAINYWPDAQVKLDPQRECIFWRYAPNQKDYEEIGGFTVKSDDPLDLGDTPVRQPAK